MIEKVSRSYTASVRLVQRATVIYLSHQGYRVASIAQHQQVDEDVIRKWIKGFGEQGVASLEDVPCPGAPSCYTPENKALVVQTTRTRPRDLGLPFVSWTFDCLTAKSPIAHRGEARLPNLPHLRCFSSVSSYGVPPAAARFSSPHERGGNG